ncbi:MAG: recombination protein RecR [Chloroflexi bacterium]|nr:recombination protein RecR [Chloroflexota bacterium]MBI3338689.1 recombination protein RecR [Chloroflexota bacterium]
MILPEPIQKLINSFERLPGIGPKSASRLAFFLLRAPDDISRDLSEALNGLKDKIAFCEECFNITEAGRSRCEICENPKRDGGVICVVEEALDVLALERINAYSGRYHVLHGVLSPIEGIGPDDIKARQLIERVAKGGVKEVVLATNPSMEGDATALYLQQQLRPFEIQVTRLARGLPVGGDLEYADQNTLLRALSGRQEMG